MVGRECRFLSFIRGVSGCGGGVCGCCSVGVDLCVQLFWINGACFTPHAPPNRVFSSRDQTGGRLILTCFTFPAYISAAKLQCASYGVLA